MERGAEEMSESQRRRRCWPEEEKRENGAEGEFLRRRGWEGKKGMGGKKGGEWERREGQLARTPKNPLVTWHVCHVTNGFFKKIKNKK